jgi:hypothetical protein
MDGDLRAWTFVEQMPHLWTVADPLRDVHIAEVAGSNPASPTVPNI